MNDELRHKTVAFRRTTMFLNALAVSLVAEELVRCAREGSVHVSGGVE